MNIHVTYAVWTYSDVRARIIEAAETLKLGEADLGPGYAGQSGEVVQDANDAYGYGTFSFKRIPTGRALTEMEETWTWINTWLNEDDRKLVYEYGFIMTRKGLNIAGWCERNGWIRRTFERAVNRCCQRIADNLNRKHEVRLTTTFDGMSQNQSYSTSFEVASDNRASVTRQSYHRADDATPIHVPGSEAEIAQHIEKVNKQRREEAERQRKAAHKRAEEAAKIVARHADKAAKRKQARAAA